MNPKANSATHSARSKPSRKITQSYRLYKLLHSKKQVNIGQIARVLGVDPMVASSYVAALRQVYGARVIYNHSNKDYTLLNKVKVPPAGIAGQHLKKLMAQKHKLMKGAERPRHRRAGERKQSISRAIAAHAASKASHHTSA